MGRNSRKKTCILSSFTQTNGPQQCICHQHSHMHLLFGLHGPTDRTARMYLLCFFLHIIYILFGGTTGRNNVHGGKTLHMHSFAIDQCAIAKPSVFSNFKRMMYWFPRTSGPQQCLYDPQFNMHHFDATSHFHQKFNLKKTHKNTHAKNLSSLSCF